MNIRSEIRLVLMISEPDCDQLTLVKLGLLTHLT